MIRHQITQVDARRGRAIAQRPDQCIGQARLAGPVGRGTAKAQDCKVEPRDQPQARFAGPAHEEGIVAGKGLSAWRRRLAMKAGARPVTATGRRTHPQHPAGRRDLRALEPAIVQQQFGNAQPIHGARRYLHAHAARGRGVQRLPHIPRQEQRVSQPTGPGNERSQWTGIGAGQRGRGLPVLPYRNTNGHHQQRVGEFSAINEGVDIGMAVIALHHQMPVARDEQATGLVCARQFHGGLQRLGVKALGVGTRPWQAASVTTRHGYSALLWHASRVPEQGARGDQQRHRREQRQSGPAIHRRCAPDGTGGSRSGPQ